MNPASRFRIGTRHHGGAVLIRPVGVLDVFSYPNLRDCLLKCLSDEPAAVMVDMDDLDVPAASMLSVFVTVRMQHSESSTVPLVLIAHEPGRRAQLLASTVARFVPVHADLEAAMRALGRLPDRRLGRMTLPGVAGSSAVARRYVRRLCRRWGVARLAEDAAAVATELVENVVQHTTSPAELRLELHDGLLSVAVSDRDPRPAVIREAVCRAMPSAGLAIVAKLARTWGCTPTSRGKVVWAVLREG